MTAVVTSLLVCWFIVVALELWIWRAPPIRRLILGVYLLISAVFGTIAVLEVARAASTHQADSASIPTLVQTYVNLALLWPFLVYWWAMRPA